MVSCFARILDWTIDNKLYIELDWITANGLHKQIRNCPISDGQAQCNSMGKMLLQALIERQLHRPNNKQLLR
ncbi:hypothetical protein L1987_08003 [Smallanthus sonchifolius]|uniref:Uncharacterized protein n=1 Tax=Smallanthus sonchifolius TaxID=185202 RepID=A0ACB9JL73_9ASTR|nr:hypothetical protein L1987_08003 [Smallanthus sonchifolius]